MRHNALLATVKRYSIIVTESVTYGRMHVVTTKLTR